MATGSGADSEFDNGIAGHMRTCADCQCRITGVTADACAQGERFASFDLRQARQCPGHRHPAIRQALNIADLRGNLPQLRNVDRVGRIDPGSDIRDTTFVACRAD